MKDEIKKKNEKLVLNKFIINTYEAEKKVNYIFHFNKKYKQNNNSIYKLASLNALLIKDKACPAAPNEHSTPYPANP